MKFIIHHSSPKGQAFIIKALKRANFQKLITSCLLLTAYCLLTPGCYSFKGTSIPPEVNTFYVDNIDNQTSTAPPTLSQIFSEALKDKIRNESRLQYDDTNPDIEFSGSITEYRVTAEAPQPGQTTAFNLLTISIQVEYISTLDEKDNWKQRFSHQADFGSDENLIDKQDELIEEITEELVERVFNKAFTNW